MGGLSHRFAVKVFHRVIKIFTADVRAKISQYFQFQRIVITITVSVISRIKQLLWGRFICFAGADKAVKEGTDLVSYEGRESIACCGIF